MTTRPRPGLLLPLLRVVHSQVKYPRVVAEIVRGTVPADPEPLQTQTVAALLAALKGKP